jgi:prepilin-type N-terminal cleavage/methylation domain-containing protein
MKSSKKIYNTSRGFSLIELLVVIAIIGILSNVVLASLNTARAKARDVRKQVDFRSISTALQLFYDSNGRMPNNYNPCCGATEGSTYYDQSMQELVTGGFLGAIPKSLGGGLYRYYDYGPNNNIGAIMVTSLETAPNTTTGISPSCRPWAPAQNWCSQSSSKEYCICNPY